MKEEKNIDRLFQERFKDFEALPDDAVWDKIQTKLDLNAEEQEKVVPLIPWWLRRSAAVALLLIAIGLGTYFSPFETNTELQPIPDSGIVNSNPNNDRANGNDTNKNQDNFNNSSSPNAANNNALTNTGSGFSKYSNAKHKNGYNKTNNVNNQFLSGKENENYNDNFQNNNLTASRLDEANTLAEVITNNWLNLDLGSENKQLNTDFENVLTLDDLVEIDEEKQEKHLMWTVKPNFAPIYFGSLSQASPISNEFSSNKKTGKMNLSYGINVGVNVNKKLVLRSGINKVQYGYSTEGVYFTNSAVNARDVTTINYSASGSTIVLANSSADLLINSSGGLDQVTESNASVEKYQGSLVHNFNYYEVPVELKYNVLSSKFGISIIGGVSTLILDSNEIMLESAEGMLTGVGEANNMNHVNFSTNLGIGLDYRFSENIFFSVEPTFKYQLSTFTRDNGFQPYSLGLYTGFSFRF